MTTVNVQFADGTDAKIISYFASQQNEASLENSGQVDTSDARWHSFYDGLPAMNQAGLPMPT
ncbi:hypothetical protein [Paraburkholderia sediminicola]|uniref:hypothetical protein n=1 Tax=Paraburkholderia sediminicola TaxID=458836 RepID=UPI0038B77037